MSKLNVYLSSPYMEFSEIRDQFLTAIKARNYLYEITAMEDYRAADRDVLQKCLEDVDGCHIYVLILGDQYGSIAKKNGQDSGRSFTYWEYEQANKRKAGGHAIERLILLKAGAPPQEEPPLLTAWKQEIARSQIQTVYYNEQSEIPQKILESLDYFTLKRIEAAIEKKDLLRDKIYLCDRTEVDQEFTNSFDADPIQFFMLNGHENDLPHYFIRRKEIEYEDRELVWKDIRIVPNIPDTVQDFEKAEVYIKSEIFNRLKYKKFRLPKDVTPQGIIDYMTEQQIDYLSISWYIESALWKNDRLKQFVNSFYDKYNSINASLQTDKCILFFGILQYVESNMVTEEEFYKRISDLRWEHAPMRLNKIEMKDIKYWLEDAGIEMLESRKEELINLYLKELNMGPMFFKEVESRLAKIIDLYNR
jgi:hypothetical protein